MTGEHLTSLFAEGTTPARDAVFTRRVDARIASERRGRRLPAPAARAAVGLSPAATLFVTVRVLDPALKWIAENSPQCMGVPLPLVLAVLAVGVGLHLRRLVRLRLG